MNSNDIPLAEGYYIFTAMCNEEKGYDAIARLLTDKIRDAQKVWDIEFISNAKIDADGGGNGRSVYFGFQCTVLKKKAKLAMPKVTR